MESSRIFIKNLPPGGLNEADLRKHFSARGQDITDIRLIPRKRIGYIGYKTPQDAVDAVNYFNRSYIRMSRLNVELAKPVSWHLVLAALLAFFAVFGFWLWFFFFFSCGGGFCF